MTIFATLQMKVKIATPVGRIVPFRQRLAAGSIVGMQISIDPGSCAGHGRCYALVPDLFDADDEGHGVVTHPDVPPELAASAQGAVANCPEGAVKITT